MKTIIIISLGSETGNSLKNQLIHILKDNIRIMNYSLNKTIPDKIEADLIIFSSKDVADIVISSKNINSRYIIVKRVIQHGSIDRLLTLEKDTEVLLVNDTKETCETVIKQLVGHGVCDLKYHMYYPGIEQYKDAHIAITPGEKDIVPKTISKIIDIGPREMDIVSIMEVVMYLNCIEEYGELLSSYFFGRIVNKSKKYIEAANKSSKLTRILSDVLNNSEEGIIYTNTIDEVLVFNKVASDILGVGQNIIGKNIYDINDSLRKDLTIINNNEIYISKKEIYSNRILMGYMIILETTSMVEKLDEERRRKKKQSGNNAKYTFEDMKGSNAKIVKSINLAKKIAKTSSTVLIQGESGTGKEILAQSIHNESDRNKYPFVAINFSALSENLLESELFGYEEGAFSGAKKGGKVGLFKKAHKGTIFLDEIGDAPYHFQTRLLRVLQEREVTPVGSTETIPIDVRIIAATNKDLLEEVKNKKFREDLFYRINVMPLYTVPLRERKDDIEILMKYYLKKQNIFINIDDFIDKEVLEFFKIYNWPGNIRELVNIIEYLVNIKEPGIKIRLEDLPKYILSTYDDRYDSVNIKLNKVNNHIGVVGRHNSREIEKNEILKLNEDELWILEKIYIHEGIGRRLLSTLSIEEYNDMGEGKLRGIMKKLKELNLIEINRGKKGTKITKEGIEALKRDELKG